jgi:hypothetical protein
MPMYRVFCVRQTSRDTSLVTSPDTSPDTSRRDGLVCGGMLAKNCCVKEHIFFGKICGSESFFVPLQTTLTP